MDIGNYKRVSWTVSSLPILKLKHLVSRSPVGQGQCFDFTVKDHTPWYNRVEFVEKYESCCEYFWGEKSEQSIQQNC